VFRGGIEEVTAGGTASFTTISSGGVQVVDGDTSVVSTTISNGGVEFVLTGSGTSATTISAGGVEIVSSGATASGTVLSTGGFLVVLPGAAQTGTIPDGGLVVSTGVVVYHAGSGATDYATSVTGEVLSTSFFALGPDSTEYVLSGGSANDTTVDNAGSAVVYAGGSVTDGTIYGGGAETISSGGTATDDVVSGGLQFVQGSAIGNTVAYGGTQDITGTGSATGTMVSSGGTQEAGSGGTTISTIVTSSGLEYVFSGSTASGTAVENGGSAVVEFDGQLLSAAIAGGGTEVIDGGTANLTSMSIGGSILLSNIAYNSSTDVVSFDSATDVLTVISGTNTIYTQTLAGTYGGDTFTPSGSSELLITLNGPPCYCAGTLILTDRGDRPVEDLRIGDNVITLSGDARTIRWIGHRRLDVSRHPAPEQVQPIRIQADAVADGIPCNDLRVSPDHAILFDGGLIPARLLVNGASILQEIQCQSVTYYHVELDTHDILLAEGLAAESYLDTGNRGLFENAGVPMILHPDCNDGQQQRASTSCRPFLDSAADAEPIWRRLAMRAIDLGLQLPPEPETTLDPALCVVVDGVTLHPVSASSGCYTFFLPKPIGSVQLMSRSANPHEARPWVEDHRRLGVMVGKMVLWVGVHAHPIALDHPELSAGWWDVESHEGTMRRWTDGAAVIPLPISEPGLLEIVVADTLAYPMDRTSDPDDALVNPGRWAAA
jgi:antigen 43